MSLIQLPTEVLGRVLVFVEPKDLPRVRTCCKTLERVANDRFADEFIRCRKHCLSYHSLNALLDIASHPYFGQFVKAVSLNPTCPFELPATDLREALEKFGRVGFLAFLQAVFAKLGVYQRKITLGVDEVSHAFGLNTLLQRPDAYTYKRKRQETLWLLVTATTRSEIRALAFEFHVRDQGHPYRYEGACRFVNIMSSIFIQRFYPSVRISVGFPHISDFAMSWTSHDRSLMLMGLRDWETEISMSLANPVRLLLSDRGRARNLKIAHLNLDGCRIQNERGYLVLTNLLHDCLETLQSVKISKTVLKNDCRWSDVLSQIARAPDLQDFQFASLERTIHTQINNQDESAMVLQVTKWQGHGPDAAAELQDLAAVVAADETRWEMMDDRTPEKWTYIDAGIHQPEPPATSEANPSSTSMMTCSCKCQAGQAVDKNTDLVSEQSVSSDQEDSSEAESRPALASTISKTSKETATSLDEARPSISGLIPESDQIEMRRPTFGVSQTTNVLEVEEDGQFRVTKVHGKKRKHSVVVGQDDKDDEDRAECYTGRMEVEGLCSSFTLLSLLEERKTPVSKDNKRQKSFEEEQQDAASLAFSSILESQKEAIEAHGYFLIGRLIHFPGNSAPTTAGRQTMKDIETSTMTLKEEQMLQQQKSTTASGSLHRVSLHQVTDFDGEDRLSSWSREFCTQLDKVTFLGSAKEEVSEDDWTSDLDWDPRQIFGGLD